MKQTNLQHSIQPHHDQDPYSQQLVYRYTAYTHTRTRRHARTRAHARTHAHTYTYTHARTHAHTHIHARTHTRTHAHTHTHTHTHVIPDSCCLIRKRFMIEADSIIPCLFFTFLSFPLACCAVLLSLVADYALASEYQTCVSFPALCVSEHR